MTRKNWAHLAGAKQDSRQAVLTEDSHSIWLPAWGSGRKKTQGEPKTLWNFLTSDQERSCGLTVGREAFREKVVTLEAGLPIRCLAFPTEL